MRSDPDPDCDRDRGPEADVHGVQNMAALSEEMTGLASSEADVNADDASRMNENQDSKSDEMMGSTSSEIPESSEGDDASRVSENQIQTHPSQHADPHATATPLSKFTLAVDCAGQRQGEG